MKNRYKPWVTSDIVQLMHRRYYVYKKSLKNLSIDLVNEYKSLRNEVGVQIELSRKRYYDDLYNVGKSNSKSLWKELKKLSGGIPCENTSTKLSAEEFNFFLVPLEQIQLSILMTMSIYFGKDLRVFIILLLMIFMCLIQPNC